jgi:hypothetical protein
MKKYILIIGIALFLIASQFAYAQKVVRVRNVQEFVTSVASNVTIELEYGLYNLSAFANPNGENGYNISYVDNLTIRGVGRFPSELVLDSDPYATVMIFTECNNIRLENVEIGHGAVAGFCTGAVIKAIDTKGLTVSKSVLYGSGTYGIESRNSQNITVDNSTVRSCTYGAMYMTNTPNISFNNVTFTDNRGFDIFHFENCPNVVFNACIIKDNHNEENSSLFEVSGNTSVNLNNTLVKFNNVGYLANKRNAFRLFSSFVESNSFKRSEYK